MKFTTFILLFLIVFAASQGNDDSEGASEFYPADSGVITTGDFPQLIAESDYAFVEFYAPWCGHCQHLKPEIIKAAQKLGDEVKILAIDATEHQDLAAEYGIQGFPTMKFFRKGVPTDYEGGRTAEDIVGWIHKRMGPAIVTIAEQSQVEEVKSSNKISVFGYFAEGDDKVRPIFLEVAERLRDDASFAEISDSSIASSIKLQSQPSLVLFGNDGLVKYFDFFKDDGFNADALESFVVDNLLPLIGEISAENFQKYLSRDLPLFWIFLGADEATNDKFLEGVRPAAEEFQGKVLFVYLDGTEHVEHAKYYGLNPIFPAGILVDDHKMAKFPFQKDGDNLEVSTLTQFLKDVEEGKIEQTIRSEPIPEENDGPVTILVRDQFKELVEDEKDDVFILFHAPYCGHCKAMMPTFDQLGSMLSTIKGIKIMKMDATANDVPAEFEVEGFPTLYLVPGDDKTNLVPFDSNDRSLEGLLDFLQSSSKAGDQIAMSTHYKGLLSFVAEFGNIKDQINDLIDTVAKQAEEIDRLEEELIKFKGEGEGEDTPTKGHEDL